jgi:hypothetical protein
MKKVGSEMALPFYYSTFDSCDVPQLSDPLKTFDNSNLSRKPSIADICNISLIQKSSIELDNY